MSSQKAAHEFVGEYGLIDEDGLNELMAEMQYQTSDNFTFTEFEDAIVMAMQTYPVFINLFRPSCNCDDCSDETCPENQ